MISKRLSETPIDYRYTAAVAAAASAAAASSSSNGLTNNNKQDESSPPGSFGLYSAIGEITDTFEDPHASALVSADKGRTDAHAHQISAINRFCDHCLSHGKIYADFIRLLQKWANKLAQGCKNFSGKLRQNW